MRTPKKKDAARPRAPATPNQKNCGGMHPELNDFRGKARTTATVFSMDFDFPFIRPYLFTVANPDASRSSDQPQLHDY